MRLTNPGFPDIIAFRPATKDKGFRKIAVECKREGEEPTEEQRVWLMCFHLAQFETYVWYPTDQNIGWIDQVLES